MQQRSLGNQGLAVSAMGLGCMGMTWAYAGHGDETGAAATLLEAVEAGVTLFDTAEVYGPFSNERLLGRALSAVRDQIVLATKFGFRIDSSGRISGLDSRPSHIREAVDGSLERLRTDRIDLLYQHRVDRSVPIEDVVGAMAELVRAGKVRYLGLSEASPATLRRACAVHPISALQTEYSLWERGAEAEILPTCRELGVGFVAYSPLGRGFLTGTARRAEELPADDSRRQHPRFQGGNFDRNAVRVAELALVARELGATPAQLALAWLLRKGPTVPIVGTKNRHRLRENLGALALDPGPATLERLDQLFAAGTTAGERYGEAMMTMLDRP